jgi:toxin ParE1/3/4
MPYQVVLTDSAAQDLSEIDNYIALSDSPEKADYVLSKIEQAINSLADFPERGVYPRELSSLGIHDYREHFFKPYRIIYRILDKSVYIYLIVDGRRDMQTLLSRRLLESQ